jgi:hypothetical protein
MDHCSDMFFTISELCTGQLRRDAAIAATIIGRPEMRYSIAYFA